MAAVLQLNSISKSFSGITVLDQVDFSLHAGSVVALAGENGAGKSTLMKIISGVYKRDAGVMRLNGKECEFATPRQAMDAGIAIIHQELNLLQELSVAENIFLGREPRNTLHLIDRDAMLQRSRELLSRLKQDIDPTLKVARLSIAQQQMVEIAKALSFDAGVIIMDEPTDALSERETQILFDVVKDLQEEGKALAFISHRLGEIFRYCDRLAVLRDGAMVFSGKTADLDEEHLIRHMVGRELSEKYPYTAAEAGKVALHADNITAPGINAISFEARAGEVLGFSGLVGAGRTELAKALYGDAPITQGTLHVHDKESRFRSPQQAVDAGIAYVSEDRKSEGLIQMHSLADNITLSALRQLSKPNGLIDRSREKQIVGEYINTFAIKTKSPRSLVSQLSGGNQQKVSIAKSLATRPTILILDEPTRGVDVGAKREIYALIQLLKQQGLCILLMSSDLPEVLGICDRIMVLARGRLTAELNREEADQENIMRAAVA